ncbi:hypothetical protein WA158_002052 [Blastocystis sp. Blastoise]
MENIVIVEENLDTIDFFGVANYEPIGRAYFESTTYIPSSNKKDKDVESDDEEDFENNERFKAHANRIKTDDSEDYYSILGLGDIAWNATQEQIKTAYRKLVLLCHPDKVANPTEETKKRFLKIQEAFNVLSNETKKMEYDSDYKFDESIPPANQTGDFFDIYEPVLTRNARFSQVQPIPNLGDMSTPYSQVAAFYRFWFQFKSTRTFGNKDEYNPEEAEGRAEKRWMMSMNKANRKKLKEKDNKRIATLVEQAYARDPRIKKHNEEERERKLLLQKQKEEEEKRKQIQKLLEEKRKKEEEERLKLEEEKKKKEEQAERQRQKREKKRQVTAITNAIKDKISEDDIKFFMENVTPEEFVSIYTELMEKKDIYERVNKFIIEERENMRKKEEEDERRRAEDLARHEKEKAELLRKAAEDKTGDPWGVKEDYALIKAIKKYPGGYRNRWETIATYVNEYGEGSVERTPNQCRYRQIDLNSKSNQSTKVDTDDALRIYNLKKASFKEKNHVALTLDQRYAGASENIRIEKPTVSPAVTTPAPAPAETNNEGWTGEQQRALEAAMKKYPATMDKNERWKLIAEAVPGKTKKDCVQRVKSIISQMKAKE